MFPPEHQADASWLPSCGSGTLNPQGTECLFYQPKPYKFPQNYKMKKPFIPPNKKIKSQNHEREDYAPTIENRSVQNNEERHTPRELWSQQFLGRWAGEKAPVQAITLRTGTRLAVRSLKHLPFTMPVLGAGSWVVPPICQAFFTIHRREPPGRGQGTWNCTVFEALLSSREWVTTIFWGGTFWGQSFLCSVIKTHAGGWV